MRIALTIRDRARALELSSRNGSTSFAIDGRNREADAVPIAPALYSILLDGQSFEAHVRERTGGVLVTIAGREFPVRIENPREWQGRRGAAIEAEGRQHVLASMPGKVVRLLARAGQLVEAGQALLVLEAMKMQNEVRSPKTGVLERLLVAEGQTVNAGEVLAVVG
ncbi:MAG TPA: biotin/lipoyl-containing protein [Candidatus Cybelea sp.]|nr:biotin/lipoyl-containing protein [Candidatus Cybelea sp.]